MTNDKIAGGRVGPPGEERWRAIVDAARGCVGTRFRAQGRTPGLGLDCVGVVLVAAAAAGISFAALPAYALDGDHEAEIECVLARIGCCPSDMAAFGDLLVIAPALRRRHLAVVTPAGVVHAHAGVGRVVEGPVDANWTIIGAWRLPGAC